MGTFRQFVRWEQRAAAHAPFGGGREPNLCPACIGLNVAFRYFRRASLLKGPYLTYIWLKVQLGQDNIYNMTNGLNPGQHQSKWRHLCNQSIFFVWKFSMLAISLEKKGQIPLLLVIFELGKGRIIWNFTVHSSQTLIFLSCLSSWQLIWWRSTAGWTTEINHFREP